MKSLVFVVLFFATSAHAAEPAPAVLPPSATEGWSFQVYDADAQPGDRIAYRLAWTNMSRRDVRVPADLMSQLAPSATYKFRMITAKAVAARAIAAQTKSESVTWLWLRPGESLQQLGELGDFFPACEEGCPQGSYELAIAPAKRHWDGLAEDQIDPQPGPLGWKRELELKPQSLAPVGPGPGLELKLTKRGIKKDGTVSVAVTVTNKHPVAVWVPKSMVAVNWAIRTPDGTARTGSATSGIAAWTEADGVLLKPGKSHTWSASVDTDPAAAKVWLTAYAAPTHPFSPRVRGLASRFYFEGTLTSPELEVR